MREVGLENWQIVPLLTFACDKITIRNYEKSWHDLLNANLNTVSPVLDLKKRKDYMTNYRKLNKETIKQWHAKHYEANKDIILRKEAEYRKNNMEVIQQRNLNYYENNKTVIKKRHKDYRKLNEESIKLYNANKYIENKKFKKYYCSVCEMSFGTPVNLKNHLGTLKHSYAWLTLSIKKNRASFVYSLRIKKCPY